MSAPYAQDALMRDGFTRSLWAAISGPGPDLPALSGEDTADVLVVGAGYLGMTTALNLAAEGLRVVLLEAGEPGFGASGRNTGFVVPALKKALSPENVDATYGRARGERFNAMIGGAGHAVFDAIRRHCIDCTPEQTGWMQPAHSRAALEGCRRQAAEWAARGFSAVTVIDADETRARTGMEGYHGALLVPSGGQVNPLAYARGLARACVAEGVRLYAQSPVTGLAREGRLWAATTPSGRVTAPRVLMTTNAMIGRLIPEVAASIIPTYSFQIATQSFGPEVQARVLPARSPVADARRHLFAARWSPDGRIVGGGLVYPGPGRLARARARFSHRFERFLPALGPVRAEFSWACKVAVTLDALPRLQALDEGLWAAIGCNGRGVALTAAYGIELGRFLSDRVTAADFVVPVTRPEPVPMRALAGMGPYAWLPWSEFRDRRETEALPRTA
ncbi:FAD-binding oxidoreductase [Frigidibacter sp. MR17.14]|uniref:NAD(P)/FAD-dependent oxidoreductase n=1 Tax=Frigidibacter sp. MR17.14 TaxID=3126509 RepID=UPI003012C909